VIQIPLGVPFTVPVTYQKPVHNVSEFTFQIDLVFRPENPIEVKWAHKRLYVYATYDPPIQLSSGPLPVTFSCVNTRDLEQLFSVFDEFVYWHSIGKGSLGFLSFGPTGPTHVIHLNRGKCDRSTSGFLIRSVAYQGIVTLNFLLAEAAKGFSPSHRLAQSESIGLLLQSSVNVVPGSMYCLSHAVRITGRDYEIKQLPPLMVGPGGDTFGLVGQVVNALSPNIVVRRRNLLPIAFPYSLSDAARFVGLPPPNRIGIVSSFVPIVVNTGNTTVTYYATTRLLAFNAAGQFVAQHEKQSWGFAPMTQDSSFNGAMTTESASKYQPNIGTFRSPYYPDHHTVTVDLNVLLEQGIYSIAIAVYPDAGWTLPQFKRKAIRIIDVNTNTEIGLFDVVAPWRGKKWSMLVGGLVFVNDVWSWLSCENLIVSDDLVSFQTCWYQRLLQSQSLPPQ
jgi:hypothetical protein